MKKLNDLIVIALLCLCAASSLQQVARVRVKRASQQRISIKLSKQEYIN